MLSILQKQSKLLEKELKDKQKECLEFQHLTSDLRSQIENKDLRISILEAELAALKKQSETNIEDAPMEASEGGHEAVQPIDLADIVNELTRKVELGLNELTKKESELFFAELKASMAALQLATKDITHMDTVKKLETALESAANEIAILKKDSRNIDELELELIQTKQNLLRRDEEIEFLSHVHEASSGYEWTNNQTSSSNMSNVNPDILADVGNTGFASGSGGRAVSLLRYASKPSDSVRFLMELGASEEAAIQVLESVNGDVDRAALVLFP